MPHLFKGVEDRRADLPAWRRGVPEVRKLGLELSEFLRKLIIFIIGKLRLIKRMIQIVVPFDLLPERFYPLFCFFFLQGRTSQNKPDGGVAVSLRL